MAPEVTDWITSIATVAAVIAALYIAHKQISIQNRQVAIQDKQADFQERQTNISKLQSDIAIRQTDIIEKQIEIAHQQLIITEYQEQERRKGRLQAELAARIEHRTDGDRRNNYLSIENRGPSDARDITMLVEGDLNQHILGMPIELPLIVAVTTFEYLILLCAGMSSEFILDMSWCDESGELHHKRIPLRV